MTYRVPYLKFALLYAGLAFGVPIALMALYALTGINLWSASLATIPMMLASMGAGGWFATDQGRVPTRPEAWTMTLAFAGIGLGISLVQAAVIVAMDTTMLRWVLNIYVGWLFVGFVGFLVLAGRFFLSYGARSQIKFERKKLAKQTAKDAK